MFTFSELNDEQKKKVLDKYRYFNAEGDWYSDNITTPWEEKLERVGFIGSTIRFSGFRSQGDGANFSCKEVDLMKLAQFLGYNKAFKYRLNGFVERGEIEARINDVGGGHYEHKRTKVFSFCEDQPKTIIDKMEKDGEEARLKLCERIYKDLQKWYEGLISDEELTEYFEANEHWVFNSETLEIENWYA